MLYNTTHSSNMKVTRKSRQLIIMQDLDTFLESATPHGLNYLQRKHNWCTKLFWAICVVIGLTLTDLFIVFLFKDWYASPIVTNIESATISVSNLPFPAVTVCPEKAQLDQWAYIDKMTKLIKYECERNTNRKRYPECGTAKAIREDLKHFFKFVATTVYETVAEAIQQGEETINGLRESGKIRDNDDIEEIADLIKSRPMFVDQMIEFMTENMGKLKGLNVARHIKKTLESIPAVPMNETLSDEEAFKLAEHVFLISENFWGSSFTPLSLLISHFAPLLPVKSFRKDYVVQDPDVTVDCNQILQNNTALNDLNQLFAKYAETFGIGNNTHKISLFDIPGLLMPPDRKSANMPTLRELYPFTVCSVPGNNVNKKAHKTFKDCLKSWEKFVQRRDNVTHPCDVAEDPEDQLCCYWTKLFGDRLEEIMIVMKNALHRGTSFEHTEELASVWMKPGMMLPFELHELFDGWYGFAKSKGTMYDFFAMIPHCSFHTGEYHQELIGHEPKNHCNLFKPTVTNKGICQSFNSQTLDELMHSSKFTGAFKNAHKDELEIHDQIIRNCTGPEELLGLTFFLDRETVLRPDWWTAKETNWGTFRISINDFKQSFQMKTGTTNVRMGYRTEILVTPSTLSAQDIIPMSIEDRKCRFEHELTPEMTIFKQYSRSACEFECLLRKARDFCRCTPYNYPFEPTKDIQICDLFGHYCFDSMMKNRSSTNSDCNCLPDCERTDLSFVKLEEPLDAHFFCSNQNTLFIYAMTKQAFISDPFLHIFTKLFHNLTEEDYYMRNKIQRMRFCKEMISKDIAVVNVRLATDTYVSSIQRRKVTLPDKVASIGGTLGLFTGMSFISIIEIVYWICKLLVRGLKHGFSPKQNKIQGTRKKLST